MFWSAMTYFNGLDTRSKGTVDTFFLLLRLFSFTRSFASYDTLRVRRADMERFFQASKRQVPPFNAKLVSPSVNLPTGKYGCCGKESLP
jgi:hypothetical protein